MERLTMEEYIDLKNKLESYELSEEEVKFINKFRTKLEEAVEKSENRFLELGSMADEVRELLKTHSNRKATVKYGFRYLIYSTQLSKWTLASEEHIADFIYCLLNTGILVSKGDHQELLEVINNSTISSYTKEKLLSITPEYEDSVNQELEILIDKLRVLSKPKRTMYLNAIFPYVSKYFMIHKARLDFILPSALTVFKTITLPNKVQQQALIDTGLQLLVDVHKLVNVSDSVSPEDLDILNKLRDKLQLPFFELSYKLNKGAKTYLANYKDQLDRLGDTRIFMEVLLEGKDITQQDLIDHLLLHLVGNVTDKHKV